LEIGVKTDARMSDQKELLYEGLPKDDDEIVGINQQPRV